MAAAHDVGPWLPGYPRQQVGPGLEWFAGAWKATLHSTETRPESAAGIINGWTGNPGLGASHFLMNRPGDIRQTLPLTRAAYTLQNPPGGVDTNRARNVQIEVCNYAINPALGRPDWGEDWYEAIAEWLADLVAHGVDLDLTVVLADPFPIRWVGFPAGFGSFTDFNGVLDHALTPEQPDRHWDVGAMRSRHLLTLAQGTIPPIPPPPEELTVADIAALTNTIHADHNDTRAYMPPLAVKVAGDPAQYLIVQTGVGLARQHLSGPLKEILQRTRQVSTLFEDLNHDYVELTDPDEIAALLALPVVG